MVLNSVVNRSHDKQLVFVQIICSGSSASAFNNMLFLSLLNCGGVSKDLIKHLIKKKKKKMMLVTVPKGAALNLS